MPCIDRRSRDRLESAVYQDHRVSRALNMDDPIAYFLTWVTYGTWLPGDARGWVEYRHGWQLPDSIRELEARARMAEDACRLSLQQREAVERQIAETCRQIGRAHV